MAWGANGSGTHGQKGGQRVVKRSRCFQVGQVRSRHFGQPRTGDADFCELCDAKFGRIYFRYVHNEDLVTRIPPRSPISGLGIGYWHAGQVRYFDRNGALHADPTGWQSFLDRVQAGLETLHAFQSGALKVGMIADHAIAGYVEKIAAAARA